ncbi:hypothetical protein TWF506_000206 [Arthrobotrys conoides]|uniref:Amidoligase enzyme-domain-containing protein n=1 Tax=Arthrobotrys conoides TaxID=74498 RepID=A0AAN8NZN0_9PEZI
MSSFSRLVKSIRSGGWKWWRKGEIEEVQEAREAGEAGEEQGTLRGTIKGTVKRVWKKRGAVRGLWKRKEEEEEEQRREGEGVEREEEGKKESDVAARRLQFGIELELRLKLKPELEPIYEATRAKFKEAGVKDIQDWDVFADTLKNLLGEARITAVVQPGPGKFDNWAIKTEATIGRVINGRFPVEIISSKLSYLLVPTAAGTRPMTELATVWKCLEKNYDVEVNELCSTHVHFSILDREWQLDDLQPLAKAILVLDPLVNGIIPPERQYKIWCRTNTFFSQLCPFSDDDESWSYKTSLGRIDRCEEIVELAGLMLPVSGTRYMAWNSEGIQTGQRPTMEFRRPPGSLSYQNTIT